jgi:hypothetical protein
MESREATRAQDVLDIERCGARESLFDGRHGW